MSTVIWIAVAVGFAVVLQAQFMSVMTDRIGTLESIFITYGIGGGLAALAVLFARGGNLSGSLSTVPWYVLLAGVVGLVIVGGMGVATARIGLVATVTLVIAAQFAASTIIDHFGLFEAVTRPITAQRIIGMATVLFGTWLVLR